MSCKVWMILHRSILKLNKTYSNCVGTMFQWNMKMFVAMIIFIFCFFMHYLIICTNSLTIHSLDIWCLMIKIDKRFVSNDEYQSNDRLLISCLNQNVFNCNNRIIHVNLIILVKWFIHQLWYFKLVQKKNCPFLLL